MHDFISSQEQYEKVYKYSIEEPENFWAKIAEQFTWKKKWDHLRQFGVINHPYNQV